MEMKQKQDAGGNREIIDCVETVRGKVAITFESGWRVFLPRDRLPSFPLENGTAVDRETFLQYIRIVQYPAALDRAVALLAMKPCSSREIERKLVDVYRCDQDVADLVLYKLTKEGLLDDKDFSEQWVHARMKKYGASRIYRELLAMGVDRETVRRALESCDEEEQLQTAVSLAEKKIRASRENDRSKLFRQVTGMLQRRGYSWDTAKKAFDQAMETWRE